MASADTFCFLLSCTAWSAAAGVCKAASSVVADNAVEVLAGVKLGTSAGGTGWGRFLFF